MSRSKNNEPDNDAIRERRARLIDEIRRVFAHVTRVDGVSISEAGCMDDYGTNEQCQRARASDTDTHWSEIDLDKMDPGGSALCFMDLTGFRYHIPAYMVYALSHLLEGDDPGGNCSDSAVYGLAGAETRDANASTDLNRRFHGLNESQRRCIARFLAFIAESTERFITPEEELRALRHWLDAVPSGERKRLIQRWPALSDPPT